MHDILVPESVSTIVLALFDSQYDWIVNVDVTLNPVFPHLCVLLHVVQYASAYSDVAYEVRSVTECV